MNKMNNFIAGAMIVVAGGGLIGGNTYYQANYADIKITEEVSDAYMSPMGPLMACKAYGKVSNEFYTEYFETAYRLRWVSSKSGNVQHFIRERIEQEQVNRSLAIAQHDVNPLANGIAEQMCQSVIGVAQGMLDMVKI